MGGIGFSAECIPHWIISAPKFHILAHVLWDVDRDPTAGEWQHITRTIRPDRSGRFILQLAVYCRKEGWRAWFDDIEIRKIWSQPSHGMTDPCPCPCPKSELRQNGGTSLGQGHGQGHGHDRRHASA